MSRTVAARVLLLLFVEHGLHVGFFVEHSGLRKWWEDQEEYVLCQEVQNLLEFHLPNFEECIKFCGFEGVVNPDSDYYGSFVLGFKLSSGSGQCNVKGDKIREILSPWILKSAPNATIHVPPVTSNKVVLPKHGDGLPWSAAVNHRSKEHEKAVKIAYEMLGKGATPGYYQHLEKFRRTKEDAILAELSQFAPVN